MRLSSALTTAAFLAAFAGGCSSDSDSSPTSPPPPPPPPVATLAGSWSGSQTVVDVNPETQCVSYNYLATRLNRAEAVTAAFTVNGSSVSLTYTFPFGTCTGTGTLSGTTVDVQISQCTPTEHQLSCQRDGVGAFVPRWGVFSSMRIQGSADASFTTFTGTVNHRENTHGPGGANTDPVATVANLSLRK